MLFPCMALLNAASRSKSSFSRPEEIAADAMLRWLVLDDTYSVGAVRYIRSTRQKVRSWLGAGYTAGASDSIAQYLILLLGRTSLFLTRARYGLVRFVGRRN